MPRKPTTPSLADDQAAPGGAAAVDRALSLLAAFGLHMLGLGPIWALVGYGRRRELAAARLAFRAAPGLESAVMFYWLWQLAVGEAVFRSGRVAA